MKRRIEPTDHTDRFSFLPASKQRLAGKCHRHASWQKGNSFGSIALGEADSRSETLERKRELAAKPDWAMTPFAAGSYPSSKKVSSSISVSIRVIRGQSSAFLHSQSINGRRPVFERFKDIEFFKDLSHILA